MTINTSPYSGHGLASAQIDTVESNFLFAGKAPSGTKTGSVVAPPVDIPAYSVLGRVTATGKILLSVRTATDGSQNPIGVSVEAVTAAGTDQPISMWYNGTFNMSALNWDASWATEAQKLAAFEIGQSQIVVKTPIA